MPKKVVKYVPLRPISINITREKETDTKKEEIC